MLLEMLILSLLQLLEVFQLLLGWELRLVVFLLMNQRSLVVRRQELLLRLNHLETLPDLSGCSGR